jgi:large subunit ribosomal protein L10
MPKTRQQKEELLQEFADRLNRSAAVVFVSMAGVKVGEVEQIRDGLFPQGLQLQVAKNSLLRRVLADQDMTVPDEVLDQPLGLVYSYEDAVAAPKAVQGFVAEIDALKVLGGLMDGQYLAESQVTTLAKLPGREQLLAQTVGTIAAPLNGLVNVLHGNLRGLVTALGQIRDQRQTTAA